MKYYLCKFISPRVGQAPGATALVTASGRAPRLQACRARTRSAAVALAAFAAAAQQHLLAATRTHKQAGGMVDHCQPCRRSPQTAPHHPLAKKRRHKRGS
ncbi:hypothetical protein J2W96_007892 [Variovorax guangxiensis]|nr:hypothetical protein [Variovorax guangxiensis]